MLVCSYERQTDSAIIPFHLRVLYIQEQTRTLTGMKGLKDLETALSDATQTF